MYSVLCVVKFILVAPADHNVVIISLQPTIYDAYRRALLGSHVKVHAFILSAIPLFLLGTLLATFHAYVLRQACPKESSVVVFTFDIHMHPVIQ